MKAPAGASWNRQARTGVVTAEAARAAKEEWTMSNSAKIAIGGVVVAVVLMPFIGFWLSLLVLIGVPAVAYLMLDPSQRRRLRRITRKEIGR
jgi:hypothetical protein